MLIADRNAFKAEKSEKKKVIHVQSSIYKNSPVYSDNTKVSNIPFRNYLDALKYLNWVKKGIETLVPKEKNISPVFAPSNYNKEYRESIVSLWYNLEKLYYAVDNSNLAEDRKKEILKHIDNLKYNLFGATTKFELNLLNGFGDGAFVSAFKRMENLHRIGLAKGNPNYDIKEIEHLLNEKFFEEKTPPTGQQPPQKKEAPEEKKQTPEQKKK
ncbi:MAG: hypothetical protein QW275_01795, partial [Candidatus Anstonellaceae archaeon]